ncbi:SAM-dependent methyltransferase [Herbidospora yilanensis]|uniref:SAM-dependent methyltransferase n=1 Tax=Herbidospora yilanensis TaxID=354426 RepID=UPI000782BD28|nr:SAM-dependent methyltransferase [Herbidospora yilanensis]
MTSEERAPAGIDPSVPSVARIYDYWLGGKDNFASDRAAAEKLLEFVPDAREMCRENRAFLTRTVSLLAGEGVDQFVDIGSGLPTQDNTHQVAQRVNPEAKVVYVDNDPIVLVHGRALLEDNPNTRVANGDLRKPEALLADPEVTEFIDFSRPVAVLLLSILHFVHDDDEAMAIMTEIRSKLAPGSYVVLTHAFAGEIGDDKLESVQEIYAKTAPGGLTARTRAQIASYFEGMEVVEPGIVPSEAWRPDVPWDVPVDFTKHSVLGVVARVR